MWEIPEYRRRRRTSRDRARLRRQHIRQRQANFQRRTYPQATEHPAITFQLGQQVMVRERNPASPFSPAWAGPHEIARVLSNTMYEVDKNGRQFQYHVDQLRPAPTGNPAESDSDETDVPETYVETDEPREDEPREDEPTTEPHSLQNDDSDQVSHRPAEQDVDQGPSDPGKSVCDEMEEVLRDEQIYSRTSLEEQPTAEINAMLQLPQRRKTRIYIRTNGATTAPQQPRTSPRTFQGHRGCSQGQLRRPKPQETPVRGIVNRCAGVQRSIFRQCAK